METLKDFMDKKAVAEVLDQIAAFLELKGENPFRIRAFRTAARAIAQLPGRSPRRTWTTAPSPPPRASAPPRSRSPRELVDTGRASLLEELREQIPPGLVEMLAISGLGVAKIRQIHDVLGIDSLPELEAAARDGRLAKLPAVRPEDVGEHPQGHRLPAPGERLPPVASRGRGGRGPAAGRWSSSPACVPRSSPATSAAGREVVRDLVIVLVADVAAGRAVQAPEPAARACTSSPGRTSAGSRSGSPAERARRSS